MILIPYRLTREYIKQHPELIFIHSCCWWPNSEVGPALVCKGLSNCYGVPVRWKLCKSSGYFSDQQQSEIYRIIDESLAKIPCTNPVILFPKIGNGDSRMHKFAPKCWQYMMDKLNAIKSLDYKYDYAKQ